MIFFSFWVGDFFSLVLISSLLKNKEMGGIVWGYKHCTIFHSKKKFGNCSLFFLILLLNLYELFVCVCVCVFLFTKQIMWKFTQNLFDSVLFCTGEEESPIISELLYSIFLWRFFFLLMLAQLKIYACLYLRVLVTWMWVCVHQNECKLIISVLAGVLFFFLRKKIMRSWQTFAKDNL